MDFACVEIIQAGNKAALVRRQQHDKEFLAQDVPGLDVDCSGEKSEDQ